jgi:hypothetical protein
MFLIININKPTYEYLKTCDCSKKSLQKNNFLNVKWTLKDKNLQQSCHFKLLKIKNILQKFQCSSLIFFSFDDVLFFIFYFDIILSPHFSFF